MTRSKRTLSQDAIELNSGGSIVPAELSEEEKKLYAENIMSVSSMLDELKEDQAVVSGLMEDAGVDEEIIDLATNPAVIDSCAKQLELMCALK